MSQTLENIVLEDISNLNEWRDIYLKNPSIVISNQDEKDIMFEMNFWPTRFKEHNIIIGTGLVMHGALLEYDPNALSILQTTEASKIVANDGSIYNLKDECFELVDLWDKFSQSFKNFEQIDWNYFSELLDKELTNKYRIQGHIENGDYVGFVYRDLTIDMQKEYIYIRRRIENTITAEEEIKHWLHDATGHIDVATHLLNPGVFPSERAYVKQHADLAEKGHQLDLDPTLQNVIQYQTDVLDITKSDGVIKPLTTAHPIISVHVLEEGKHGLERLRQLGYFTDNLFR